MISVDNAKFPVTLLTYDVPKRRATELQNLVVHCNYASWSIDNLQECDMLVATMNTTCEYLEEYASYAKESRFDSGHSLQLSMNKVAG